MAGTKVLTNRIMKGMKKEWNSYSAEDLKLMIDLRKAGKTYAEIAHVIGRNEKAISMKFYQMNKEAKKKGKEQTQAHAVEQKPEERKPVGVIAAGENKGMPVLQMSPREMIKKLYDLGYRIENNQLVCYVKQKVNIQDIISGQ